MSTQPSFGTLFRQSRYTRNDVDGHSVTRQNRQELFAVAGVAFLLKHDRIFRQTFLRNICDVNEANLDRQFEIEVQPASHADLLIRCTEIKALYIVEFKLGAYLQPKQDPTQRSAFLKPNHGYGWLIANSTKYEGYSSRTYIVLQNWQAFAPDEIESVKVWSRAWKQLSDSSVEECPLTRDLLDTLGGWGIASLRFRHATHMNKAKHTQDAADLFQIITAIAEEIGIKPQNFDFDVQTGEGDGAYFGMSVPFGLKQFTKLKEFAGRGEDYMGWFGYGTSKGVVPTLDVWIYCKTSKAAETPQAKALKLVQKRLGASFSGSVTGAEGHVRIGVNGDAVPDDKQWFANVFDALRNGVA